MHQTVPEQKAQDYNLHFDLRSLTPSNPFLSEDANKFTERVMSELEENHGTDICMGSPLLKKCDDSLSYQSILRYMSKTFKTYNLYKLDQKLHGQKRKLDFSQCTDQALEATYGQPMEYTQNNQFNFNSESQCTNNLSERNHNSHHILKKTKYNRADESIRSPQKLSFKKDSDSEYIHIKDFRRVQKYRQINIESLRERIEEAEKWKSDMSMETCERSTHQCQYNKRDYMTAIGNLEYQSEHSTDLDSPLEQMHTKRFKHISFRSQYPDEAVTFL